MKMKDLMDCNNSIFLCIEDKRLDVYKKLYQQLMREQMDMAWQKKKLKELIPYKWETFSGRTYQSSWKRLPQYYSFQFECSKDDVDMNVWREETGYPGFYVPNKRTKMGKSVGKALYEINFSRGVSFDFVNEMFGVSQISGRFSFPYIVYINEKIYVRMDIDIRSWTPRDGVLELGSFEWNKIVQDAINANQRNMFNKSV